MRGVVLNQGSGDWAFAELADRLSVVLGVPVSDVPAELNYVLAWERPHPPAGVSFVPLASIEIAGDKRLQASLFNRHQVPVNRPGSCGGSNP